MTAALNGKALAEKIESIIEQPPYTVEAGGLACTDRDSYAQARALLILVAVQLYPVLKRKFPPEFRIALLREAHPQDHMNASLGAAIWIRPATKDDPNRIIMHIPCRSAHSMKLLDPGTIRKHAFRALGLWAHPKHGKELDDFVAEMERDFTTTYNGKVPVDVSNLVRMRVLPERYIVDYNHEVGLAAKEKDAGAASGAAATLSPTGGGGSASSSAGALFSSAPTSLLPRFEGAEPAEPLTVAPSLARSESGEILMSSAPASSATAAAAGGGGSADTAPKHDVDADFELALKLSGLVDDADGTAAASSSTSPSATAGSATSPTVKSAYSGGLALPPGVHAKKGSELSAFKGSAVRLWWPPRGESITFASMLALREEEKERAAVMKLIEADETRRRMAEAARARLEASRAASISGRSS